MWDDSVIQVNTAHGMTHNEGTSPGKWPEMELEERQVLMLEAILGIWRPGGNGCVYPPLSFGTGKNNTRKRYGMDSHTS